MKPASILTIGLLFASLASAADTPKHNLVVFVSYDMGWGDSATFDHPLIQTPNLDKLASQGV